MRHAVDGCFAIPNDVHIMKVVARYPNAKCTWLQSSVLQPHLTLTFNYSDAGAAIIITRSCDWLPAASSRHLQHCIR